jgi:alpha-tubulin suppressor-like RCC1 family protein
VQSLVGETGWNGGGYCALLQSSGVDCWGFGDDGELGNGSDSNSATPVTVEGVGGVGTLSGVQSVLANAASYCALLNSGAVHGGGEGEDGQLGSGSGDSSSATPVEVEGIGGVGTLSGVKSVVASETSFAFQYDSYCAVLDSGAVDCWGDSEDGELGDGDIDGSSGTPVAVEGVGGVGNLADVQNVVAGSSGENYCAVLGSGDVDCWGAGGYGALGDGKASDSGTPVAVEAP